MIKLIEPQEKYMNGYEEAYLLSLAEINKGNIAMHDLMFDNPHEIDVIKKMINSSDQKKLPPHYVPSYYYFLVEEDKFLGVINIRIRLNDNLLNFGGHIGYGIHPKYWKQGYGTTILKLGLEKAKELVENDNVLITCDDDNIGSYKIIEKNGGILENKIMNTVGEESFLTRRYWIKLR